MTFLQPLLPVGASSDKTLTLQLALSDALWAVKGYTAPEVEEAATRARELCQQLGETPQLFPVLYKLVVLYNNRGEGQTARELAEQMMRLARSAQDPYLLAMAHGTLGWTLYQFGELTSARAHLEQALALYDPQTHPRSPFYMHDLRRECLSFASWTLWYLGGYPDQGLQRSQEAVALTTGLSHPLSLVVALGFASAFRLLRRDERVAREQAETVTTLATEQGFPYWVAWGARVRGGALAEQGQMEEGIAQLQQGLTAFQVIGTEVGRPRYLALLAEAYGRVGRAEEGLGLLADAVATVEKTGEGYYEAELYRLKGELALKQSGVRGPASAVQREAEVCFQKAIDIARRRSAKSWELRAVMSLSRLWQQQGKKAEAHRMLAEIYGWFTEGFDTKDLQEAKALLEKLKGE